MKQILYTIIAAILLCPAPGMAQAVAASQDTRENIVDRITEQSNGQIIIDIPEDIFKELLQEPVTRQANGGQGSRKGSGARQERVTNQGFRIQIFSDGRNQATLRTRANARANAVCSRFPKYRGQVYSFSKSPNWYTRIGNFRTREEAASALSELKRAFPAFASEMRIVKSTIVPTR